MLSADNGLPFLSYARFRFHLKVTSHMVLPPYKGAVFRGAFGNAFRKLICITPKTECRCCEFKGKCLYVALFEPPAPESFQDAAKFSQAPRPYVLNPPLTTRRSFYDGEFLEFGLTLIGPAVEALPYFIYIFIDMGRRGLGSSRGKFDLLGVDLIRNEKNLRIYEGDNRTLIAFKPEEAPWPRPEDARITGVTLKFLTPLRLKQKGDLVTRLDFALFFENLYRRLTLLAAFYGEAASLPKLTLFLNPAAQITPSANGLHWYDWERYSRRQDATMKFGGLKGSITFTGPLAPFLPYMRLGEAVNVGQSTTFGLGRYRLTTHSQENSSPRIVSPNK